MEAMINHFELLKQELPALETISSAQGEIGYFAQEALRFYSIAGTLRESSLFKSSSAAERQISHILARSLLEGFFWLIYIFDDPTQRNIRYAKKLDAFKFEYGKVWNKSPTSGKARMEPANPAWAALKPLGVSSILDQVKNDHGDGLGYLYFVYRVASFDTHGNSVESLFRSVFGKPCNFSALDLTYGFDLISNHYLVILHQLRDAGDI